MKEIITINDIENWYNQRAMKMGLNAWRPIRAYRQALNLLLNINYTSSVLDVGCGTGHFTNLISKTYGIESITGIDISDESIKICKKENPKINYIVSGMESFTSNIKFTHIVALGSLEHSLDINKTLSNLYQLGAENCQYILMVPNLNFPFAGTEQQEIRELLLNLETWKAKFLSKGFKIVNIYKDMDLANQFKGIKKLICKFVLKVFPLNYTFQFVFDLRKTK